MSDASPSFHSLDLSAFKEKIAKQAGVELVEIEYKYGYYYVSEIDPKTKKSKSIASFSLVQLPGCCAFVVSTNTAISLSFRGKKLSYVLHELKEFLARKYLYAGIFATIKDDNEAQKIILPKVGFRLLSEASGHVNPKTKNKILTYFKEIKKDE